MKIPDLHLWVHIHYSGPEILDSFGGVATKALCPVVDTFKENIKKVFRLAAFPVATYVGGKRFQMAETAAFMQISEEPFPDRFLEEVPKDVAALRDAILDGHAKSPIPATLLNPSEEEQALAYGTFGTEIIVDLLMPMQIVLAWAVIETLFTDLWWATTDLKPSIRPVDKKGNTKEFYFSKFNNNNGMHSAYLAVFNGDAKIKPAITDNKLKALFVLRNLIAHKAGICDDKYISESKGFQWLPQCASGKKIELTGQQVHNVLIEGLHAALHVVSGVDSWLVNNL
jgi:hypothetical protein